MATGLLGIGSSGLLAFQRSLDTVGHNIANVSTEGYSRQTVDLATRLPQAHGFGFMGTGVETVTVERAYDAFVDNSLRSSLSASAEFEVFHTLATRLDNALADTDAGMSASIQRFFDSVQDVADAPTSPAARQVMFSAGEQMAVQFNVLAQWMEDVTGQVNSEIRNSVNEINSLSNNIAELNQTIVIEQGRSGGQPANDLLDQRDNLIRQMSELVTINTVTQDDGSLNVMTGTGQVLVRGNTASTLQVFNETSDVNQLSVGLQGGGGVLIPVTEQLSGGKIGGVLSFRERMLDPARNDLGLVATGMSSLVNAQHRNGMDLTGELGTNVFSVASPQLVVKTGLQSSLSVDFTDVTELTGDEYKLPFSAGAWELTRKTNGQTVAMTGTGTVADPYLAEGVSITVNAAPANGDTYLVQPTRNVALSMQMLLHNPQEIAAATPVIANADRANTGSGSVSGLTITDIDYPAFQTAAGQLTPPVKIEFTSGVSYDIYDNTNPAVPVLLTAGVAYNPATGGDVLSADGYRMSLTGAPAAGDVFTTDYNTDGVGDNRNALLLASIATNDAMKNGQQSVSDTYNALVAKVGVATQQAEHNSSAQQRLLDQAIANRESISGVNLDEEAADLLRYQQAYQAAAQVIAVANELFDVILNAVRR